MLRWYSTLSCSACNECRVVNWRMIAVNLQQWIDLQSCIQLHSSLLVLWFDICRHCDCIYEQSSTYKVLHWRPTVNSSSVGLVLFSVFANGKTYALNAIFYPYPAHASNTRHAASAKQDSESKCENWHWPYLTHEVGPNPNKPMRGAGGNKWWQFTI